MHVKCLQSTNKDMNSGETKVIPPQSAVSYSPQANGKYLTVFSALQPINLLT